MDRNSVTWHGQGTAITTPFDQNGAIDLVRSSSKKNVAAMATPHIAVAAHRRPRARARKSAHATAKAQARAIKGVEKSRLSGHGRPLGLWT